MWPHVSAPKEAAHIAPQLHWATLSVHLAQSSRAFLFVCLKKKIYKIKGWLIFTFPAKEKKTCLFTFGSEPPWKTSGVKALVSASEQSAGPLEGSPSHLLPTVKGKKPIWITSRMTEILVWMLGRRQQCQTLALSFLAAGRRALRSVLSSPWLPDKFEARHSWAVTSHSAAPGVTVFGNPWPISGGACMWSDAWDNVGPLFGQAGVSSGIVSSYSPPVPTRGLPAASRALFCASLLKQSLSRTPMWQSSTPALLRCCPLVLTNAILHYTAAKIIPKPAASCLLPSPVLPSLCFPLLDSPEREQFVSVFIAFSAPCPLQSYHCSFSGMPDPSRLVNYAKHYESQLDFSNSPASLFPRCCLCQSSSL